MAHFRRAFSLSFFALLTIMVSSLMPPLGAPGFKALRRRLGRFGFWLFMLPVVAAMFAGDMADVGILVLNLALLVGIFEEFEEGGFSFTHSFFFTLLIYGVLCGGMFAAWAIHAGPQWSQLLQSGIEASFGPLGAQLGPNLHVISETIMRQLPSMLLFSAIMSLFICALTESRFNAGELASERPLGMRAQLDNFRVPDAGVWLFIASVLGRYGEFHLPAVQLLAANTMNVCLVLFAIQGMMVVLKYFETVRMHPMLQLIFGVLASPFVAPLGLMDFWLAFRGRMAKRAEQFNSDI